MPVAGDAFQGRDHVRDRDVERRQTDRAVLAQLCAVRFMQFHEPFDYGPIAGKRHDRIHADRQDAFDAVQRLAEHTAGEAGGCLVRLAGPDDGGRQAGGAAVDIALARVVVD
jgi:hypothetical protein